MPLPRILVLMTVLGRHTSTDIAKAVLLWLGLGFSLGWYYTFTYADRPAWPMPLPEPCAALLLHHFSAFPASPWTEALHWLIVFPVAGVLWISTLVVTAPFFGGTRTQYTWSLLRFSVTSAPLLMPAPLMMYLAGQTAYGFSIRHMIDVALRRATFVPGAWVTPLYVGLAVAALIWQIFVYGKIFDLHGKKAMLHYGVSAILLVLLATGAAALAAIPLHAWLPAPLPLE